MLQPSWSMITEGQDVLIWKLLLSPAGILTGEERNIEQKRTALFAINLISGNVLWRNIEIDEPWWFGSEYASADNLYLQSFRKPDMPEPLGITTLSIKDGHERWQQKELVFLFEFAGLVYTRRPSFSQSNYLSVSAKTGEIVESFGADPTVVHGKRRELETSQNGRIPSFYAESLTEENPFFLTVQALIQDVLGVSDIRGAIEFLEYNDYLIFSYHSRSQTNAEAMLRNLLTNELIVIEKTTGELRFRATLQLETPMVLPDNFFVAYDTLIYVQEKRLVAGIRLS